MQRSKQPNKLNLEALSKLRSDQGPVFSLYLDLRPAEDPLRRFNQLRQQAEEQKRLENASAEYRDQWRKETERIQRWLEQEQPRQELGQGLAIFSSLDADLWQVFHLPVPVTDRLIVREQPYIRPLEILMREYDPTLAVLVDSGAARLVEVFLGQADEVTRVETIPLTGEGQAAGLRQHVRSVIERTETAWQERPYANLVIGGSAETLGLVRAELRDPLSQRLAGEVPLSPQTGLEDVLAQVQAIVSEQERQLEARRVQELITHAENSTAASSIAGSSATVSGASGTRSDSDSTVAAVLGLEQTLLSVRAKRVSLLVVEEDFHQEGGECPNCGYLGSGEQNVCQFCGMALRPEADIIEVALKRVLDMGGEIDILRSPESRRALEPYGRIGALLHLSESPATKETANQSPIAKEGTLYPDAMHDEAIEESFPASDPPGRNH